MKLYIANCTHQNHFFNYRLLERMQPFGDNIPAGHQIMLDLVKEQVEFIIEQHAAYGFHDIKKLDSQFSGVCYSINKEIDVAAIRDGIAQKLENRDDESQKIREAGLMAMNHTMDQAVLQGGETPRPGLEIDIKGEPVDAANSDAKTFSQKLKIGK